VKSTLPRPLSSFIGREKVLAEAADLLGRNRLLTLTGPGGSGKTRLSIELAARVSPDFPDGAHFVALAAIRDPALVPSAIAQSLGLQDSRGGPLVQHLAAFLAERTVLLVLDNFEQVLSGADVVTALLAAGTGTRIVVTSRAPLRLSGEQEFPVPPMPLPDPTDHLSTAALEACESTSLFLARARAVIPDFAAEGTDAAAVASIARRLGGLPLAIELAATRTKLLPPRALLERLDHSLGLLVGGSRDLPGRQQTLRSTIAWSHDLLSDGARRLFAALSVFRGSAGLDDVEAVCASRIELGMPVVDAVQELLDQSMLRRSAPPQQPRYAMLETVREFAAERLAEMPEAAAIHTAHAHRFAALSERLERPPIWPDNEFLDLLDRDHDNLRAALDWLQENEPEAALRMAAKLGAYWSVRGHFGEGRRRLRDLLARGVGASRERVAGLNAAGWLALDQGDLEVSMDLLNQSVDLARAIGDRVGEGTALMNRGRTALGGMSIQDGGRDITQALAVLSEVGDRAGVAGALLFSGLAPQFTGDVGLACTNFARCVEYCEELGLRTLRARALQLLGIARLVAGDVPGGRAALSEGVPVVLASGDRFGITVGIGGLINLAVATDRPRLALRLVGVLDEFSDMNQVVPPKPLRELTDQFLALVRAAAGARAATLRAEGRRLALHDAVAEALGDRSEQPWRSGPGPALTPRETEVARLVAAGLSNRDIATRLFLSVRTVDVHVDRVLTKLGFHSRGQLTAWVHEHGLMPRNT
jgi:non-specific serine/threonine protein kinase